MLLLDSRIRSVGLSTNFWFRLQVHKFLTEHALLNERYVNQASFYCTWYRVALYQVHDSITMQVAPIPEIYILLLSSSVLLNQTEGAV